MQVARNIGVCIVTVAFAIFAHGTNTIAADSRFSMQACGGDKPCAFVLDTVSGEVRYCDIDGCRVLGAAEMAEKPSPFPFGNQPPPDVRPGQGAEAFPLGEMGAPKPDVVDLINRQPAQAGTPSAADAPSPFPYNEPAQLDR